MTRIKVCISDVINDPDYVYRTEMRKMIYAVNEFTDTAQTEIQNLVLEEMKRLFDTGACGLTPPVCGLLMRIGYFDKPAILDSAIGYLEHRLGIEGWR